MNIDLGKTEFSVEERQKLRDELYEYKIKSGLAWSAIAPRLNMPTGTLSAICSHGMDLSKYSHDMFAKIYRFFLQAATQDQLDEIAPIVPAYQATKTSRRVHSMLNWARRGHIVVLVGNPGVGKTAAIDQYCATSQNAWKATASPSSARVNAMLITALRATGHIRETGSRLSLSMTLRERLRGRQGVLTYDESQWLDDDALEELRAIHDDTKVGVLLTGNRDVLTRIEGAQRSAAFAQFFRRVSFRHVIEKPEAEDVALMLNAWKVTAEKEKAFLTAVAMRPGGGAIGQMNKVLELATVLAQQDDEERCFSHIEDAADQLNIGRVAG